MQSAPLTRQENEFPLDIRHFAAHGKQNSAKLHTMSFLINQQSIKSRFINSNFEIG